MSNNDMKYIDYNGHRYIYLNPQDGKFWESTEEGFEKVELDELPKKIRSELLKEMI